MKTLLLFITLFSFLQSAFLPVNLVLVLIIARGLIIEDRENLFLAFFGGIILSFLMQVNLGYYSLVFILIVKLAGLIKRFPVSFNLPVIFLAGSILILAASFLNSLFIAQPLSFYKHAVEAILVIPFYYIVKIWEERFLAKSIKLKISK